MTEPKQTAREERPRRRMGGWLRALAVGLAAAAAGWVLRGGLAPASPPPHGPFHRHSGGGRADLDLLDAPPDPEPQAR